jgi:hypothetical protein
VAENKNGDVDKRRRSFASRFVLIIITSNFCARRARGKHRYIYIYINTVYCVYIQKIEIDSAVFSWLRKQSLVE